MSDLIALLRKSKPGFLPAWLFWPLLVALLLVVTVMLMVIFGFAATQMNML